MGNSKWLAFALAAAVGLGVSGVKADTVTAGLVGVDSHTNNQLKLTVNKSTKNETGGVGLISWTGATVKPSGPGTSPYAALFATSFGTYCIDIPDHISTKSPSIYTYSLSTGLAALGAAPQPSSGIPAGGMGMAKATEISDLYGSYYSQTLAPAKATATQEAAADTNSTAFQLAIWDIIYGASFQAVKGSDITTTVLSLANSYVTNLGNTAANGAFVVLTGLPQNPGLGKSTQDQLFFVPGPVLITSSTPIPPAVWSGGVLLAALGLSRWRRHRRLQNAM